MLASKTDAAFFHVATETGMGAPFPAALGAPSLPFSSAATCKRQKVVAGRHQCKSNFFRLPLPAAPLPNQPPRWLRIPTAANFASLTPTFPTPALLPSFPPAGARSGMTAHQSGGALPRHDADQEVEVEVLAVQHTEELRWRRRLARGRGPLQVDGREGLVLQKHLQTEGCADRAAAAGGLAGRARRLGGQAEVGLRGRR